MRRREFVQKSAAVAAGFKLFPAFGCSDSSSDPLLGQDPLFEEFDVYVRGEGSHPAYRIPSAVVTAQGSVLAFCEGRQSLNDHSENDILMRRSTDGGRTWEPVSSVYEDGANVLVNPCATVLGSGRILVMFQRFPEGYHSRAEGSWLKLLTPGLEGDTVSTTLLVHSDDDGQTWSAPRDVTAGTKRPTTINSTASGPGVGIVLRRGAHQGRIIMPTNEGWWEGEEHLFNVYACYSDDEGQTWQYGDTAPNGSEGYGNEVQMVELSDGSVMLNSRSASGNRLRKVAISDDGGATWSPLLDDPDLIEPQCQGTILRFTDPLDGQPSRILFANPKTDLFRTHGTVQMSEDEGQTWSVERTITDEFYAYSCLTVLPDQTIGLLYESDAHDKIKFARFNLTWLLESSPDL